MNTARVHSHQFSRRAALRCYARAAAVGVLAPHALWVHGIPTRRRGVVVGEPTAEKVGSKILDDGGNVVDAVVAAALAATITAPHQTGIGGYGGCLTLALDDGSTTCIDFNMAAPAAARGDMFAAEEAAKPRDGSKSSVGWLAAGVPGVLGGLQLVLERYGTRSFRELAVPAIALARDGIIVDNALASAIRANAAQLAKDTGSCKLFFREGQPLVAGDRLCNPELADTLTTLADRDSVESFYRGDIAQHIADAFARHGGIVTPEDLATYEAREVAPLQLARDDMRVFTAPLTAGGLTVIQALGMLDAMNWLELRPGAQRTHVLIEVLRFAWRDRLTLLGDPRQANVPLARLLSAEYAQDSAAQIKTAVEAGKALTHNIEAQRQGGTINLSAVDDRGNMIALTLTHGESLGAKITVEGLGLTLGHGMSRFDVRPEHPNAPGPGKRPLHNMCPTIVARRGRPILAVGGRGGRRIPNAILQVLAQFVAQRSTMDQAVAAARLHTEGDLNVQFERTWPQEELAALSQIGYRTQTAASATISAVSFDPATGAMHSAMR